MKHLTLCLCFALSGACASEVETDELPPIDDYGSWLSVETSGTIPGHGNSRRVIYANEIARSFSGAGEYALGSVVVKEIRNIDTDELRYVSIMRRLEESPPGGEIEGGWLFTRADEVGASEVHGLTCWSTCHKQAPYAGAWFDYSLFGY